MFHCQYSPFTSIILRIKVKFQENNDDLYKYYITFAKTSNYSFLSSRQKVYKPYILYFIFTYMRIIAIIYFLFLAVSVFACSNSIEETVPEVSIQGTEIQIPEQNIDKTVEIIINNVLISKMYTRYVSPFTSNEWNESDTLFCLGKGHHEFQLPILAKTTEGALFVLDQARVGGKLNSLTVIKETNSIEAIKDFRKWKRYDLLKLPAFRFSGINFVTLPDSSILVSGTPYDNLKHIFSIIDYKKQKVTPLKFWPDDGVKCGYIVKHSVYTDNSRLYGNSNGRFLYQCDWSRYAFIFSIDGKNVNVIKELFSEYPNYTSDKLGWNFEFTKETMATEILNSATNNEHIYILLRDSDRKGKKFNKWETPYIYGNTIIEYDWDGNKKRIIHLDHYGQEILLSEDGKTVYLLTNDYLEGLVPEFWSYDLSIKK